MVVSTDGTCAPCAKIDLRDSKGRDGGEAKGRNIDVGMVATYDSVRREDLRPVIPAKVFRKVKDRMYEHDFGRAEKYLRNKYKAHFTEDGLKHWSEEAAKRSSRIVISSHGRRRGPW